MVTMTSNGITVEVQSKYVSSQSNPSQHRFCYAYKVTIVNLRSHPVRLISRAWVITQLNGSKKRIHGRGVIGQQPVIDPGQAFSYTSWCPLTTMMGSMKGHYAMVEIPTQEAFNAFIPEFSLVFPPLYN